jgi:hypothetical protein
MSNQPVFIDTVSLTDSYYMDLLIVNGSIRTHVLKKVAEPNHFKTVIDVEGDRRQDVILEFKKRVEKNRAG